MAAPTAPVFGINCKTYYNTGTLGSPTWTLISNLGTVTITQELGSTEVGLRSQGGWMVNLAGLKSATYAWESVYDPADTAQSALRTAYHAQTPVQFRFADQAIATTGTRYIEAYCIITKLDEPENIDGGKMVSVEAKPTYRADAAPVSTGTVS